MKIKATKVFADFINSTAKETGKQFHASIVKLNEQGYKYSFGSWAIYDAESYGDYDYNTGKYTAICVEYPANYYASCRFVSTYELTREFRARKVQDIAGLKNMIIDMFEI